MPYNFVADIFHTKKSVADFLQAKCDFTWNTAVLHFWAPPPLEWGTDDVRWSS